MNAEPMRAEVAVCCALALDPKLHRDELVRQKFPSVGAHPKPVIACAAQLDAMPPEGRYHGFTALDEALRAAVPGNSAYIFRVFV